MCTALLFDDSISSYIKTFRTSGVKCGRCLREQAFVRQCIVVPSRLESAEHGKFQNVSLLHV